MFGEQRFPLLSLGGLFHEPLCLGTFVRLTALQLSRVTMAPVQTRASGLRLHTSARGEGKGLERLAPGTAVCLLESGGVLDWHAAL